MIALQLVCLGIVGTYVAARLFRARTRGERADFARRFGALAVAAAIGEDTVIRAYGAYAYSQEWSVFVDRVPLVVILVWPVVIDSAAALAARALSGGRGRTPAEVAERTQPDPTHVAALTAAIVLADASLIEPIAVSAGLWSWTTPGIFAVPLVGIAGWAMFAGAATYVLARGAALGARGAAAAGAALVVVIAPAATHLSILASWWALFRWVGGPIAARSAIVAAWLVLLPVTFAAWRAGRRVPVAEILLRAPGAAFFFALLVVAADAAHRSELVLYALAFAPPYLVPLTRSVVSR